MSSKFTRPATEQEQPHIDEKLLQIRKTVQTHYRNHIQPNLRSIAIGIALVAFVVAATWGWKASRTQRRSQAYAALRAAGDDTDALSEVISTYAGTPAAAQARLNKAQRLLEQGDYDQAKTQFALLQQETDVRALAQAAALGEAYALEASGDTLAAEKRFEAIADRGDAADHLAVDALLGAARCARTQGKLAAAEKHLDDAVQRAESADLPAASRRAKDAKERLAIRAATPPADAEETRDAETDPIPDPKAEETRPDDADPTTDTDANPDPAE